MNSNDRFLVDRLLFALREFGSLVPANPCNVAGIARLARVADPFARDVYNTLVSMKIRDYDEAREWAEEAINGVRRFKEPSAKQADEQEGAK